MTNSEMITYRAAIIGTGRIGNSYDDEIIERQPLAYYQGENRHTGLYVTLPVNHAEAYQTTPGFSLVAAANRNTDKLNAFGTRRNIKALYSDFRRMLAEEQPDVVSICTQSPEKAEITVAAAQAGVKAIVVEKAMATSMAEADAMITACDEHNVLLVVNHPYRFSPLVRRTKVLLDEGAIGDVTSITVHASGGMLHVGTHTFDMMRYWAGDAVSIHAHIPDYVPNQDLSAVGMVTFANGVIGFFDHTHHDQQSLEVRGTRGYMTISPMVGDGWLFQFEPTVSTTMRRSYPHRLVMQPISSEPHRRSITQQLLREVYNALAHGRPMIATGHDGAAALELGIACHIAHLAGHTVTLPLAERTVHIHNR